jgi:hypothetical protein
MGHQGAQQKLAVDPVRLRPPPTLLDCNARRIEDVVRNPTCLQQPVQPKAIIAGLVATRYLRDCSELLGALARTCAISASSPA